MNRFRVLIMALGISGILGVAPLGAEEVSESLGFEIQKFPVDHQGPQVIDVEAELVYVKDITDKAYPDFEEVRRVLIEWMTAYPNETDYWEIFNKQLCRKLLKTYPMVAEVTLAMKVYPTYGIQYSHTSRCTIIR